MIATVKRIINTELSVKDEIALLQRSANYTDQQLAPIRLALDVISLKVD